MSTGSFRLSKKFRFESAHRLTDGYVGKCARLHGHSWNGELVVYITDLDPMGMAMDFADLGSIVKGWEHRLDHKVLLNTRDPLAAVIEATFGEDVDHGVVRIQGNPTCETLARLLWEWAQPELQRVLAGSTFSHEVRIEETCTTSCTYTA